jgi:hypothetical protein
VIPLYCYLLRNYSSISCTIALAYYYVLTLEKCTRLQSGYSVPLNSVCYATCITTIMHSYLKICHYLVVGQEFIYLFFFVLCLIPYTSSQCFNKGCIQSSQQLSQEGVIDCEGLQNVKDSKTLNIHSIE